MFPGWQCFLDSGGLGHVSSRRSAGKAYRLTLPLGNEQFAVADSILPGNLALYELPGGDSHGFNHVLMLMGAHSAVETEFTDSSLRTQLHRHTVPDLLDSTLTERNLSTSAIDTLGE